jgi:hypothetical protein
MSRLKEPRFENTPGAIAVRFLLGAVLGLFLGALVLALIGMWGPWEALTGLGVTVILLGVPLVCGIAGVFGLRSLADLVGELYDDIAGWW